MQKDGKRFPQLSLVLSKQPYNTTLRFRNKPNLTLIPFSYQADNNSLTLERRRLIKFTNPDHGFLMTADHSLQLSILGGIQNLLEFRPGPEPQADQVVARQQPNRAYFGWRRLGQEAPHKLIVLQIAVARGAIQAVQLHVLCEAIQPHEAFQR